MKCPTAGSQCRYREADCNEANSTMIILFALDERLCFRGWLARAGLRQQSYEPDNDITCSFVHHMREWRRTTTRRRAAATREHNAGSHAGAACLPSARKSTRFPVCVSACSSLILIRMRISNTGASKCNTAVCHVTVAARAMRGASLLLLVRSYT